MITQQFKDFVKCTHDDIDCDEYGCNECKICKSSSGDRCDKAEIMENFREGMDIRRQKKYRFSFDYSEYTTEMYNYIKRRM